VRLAGDKPGRYSVAEWEALLQVMVAAAVAEAVVVGDL
jgi:hypothetical protein